MRSLTGLAAVLREVLTTTARRLARVHGGVKRRSRFAGDTLVQTLVLGWLSNPCASLRQLCQMARIRGVVITPQGLAQRFTPELAQTLQAVFAAAAQTVVAAPDPVAIPLLQRFTGVYLVDTTTISLPAALAKRWPGCGGNAGQGEAAVKARRPSSWPPATSCSVAACLACRCRPGGSTTGRRRWPAPAIQPAAWSCATWASSAWRIWPPSVRPASAF